MEQPDYSTFFALLPAPCAVLDRECRFVAVNDLYLKTVGRSAEDLVGNCVYDLFPETEERQRMIKASFDRALAGEANVMEEIAYSIPVADEPGRMREIFWSVHSTPMPDANGRIPHFSLLVEDVTLKLRSRQMTEAVVGELKHRVKNIFTLVIGLVRLTARSHTDMDTFAEAYSDRVMALSRTHDLLTGADWNGLRMRPMLMRQLEVYATDLGERIELTGPDMRISAASAQAISMGVHELSTNAVKHGALSGEAGRVMISWERVGDDGFRFSWRETGLSGVSEPESTGFGYTLLTQVMPRQLGGEHSLEYQDDGLRYSVTAEDEAR